MEGVGSKVQKKRPRILRFVSPMCVREAGSSQ